MIGGETKRAVAKYLPIDHCGEGLGFVEPADGETFLGYPWGYMEVNATPCIAVMVAGVMVRTVNALDLSEIVFAEEPS